MHQTHIWVNKLSPEKKTEPVKYILKSSFKYCITNNKKFSKKKYVANKWEVQFIHVMCNV